jgi:hypothetical protein
VVRPDRRLYWYGKRITGTVPVAVRGDSIALGDEPDLQSPRERNAEDESTFVRDYLRMPYARALADRGVRHLVVIRMTDHAIVTTTGAIRLALEGRRDSLRGRDLGRVVDVSQPAYARGPRASFVVRGLGRAALYGPPPAPLDTSKVVSFGPSEEDLRAELRSLHFHLSSPGPVLIVVTREGVYAGGDIDSLDREVARAVGHPETRTAITSNALNSIIEYARYGRRR